MWLLVALPYGSGGGGGGEGGTLIFSYIHRLGPFFCSKFELQYFLWGGGGGGSEK